MPRSTDPCDSVLDLLEPYVDDELTPAEADRVRRHTAACPACARELALAGRIRAELRDLPRPDLPAAWIDRRPGAEADPRAVPAGLLPEHDPDLPATPGAWWVAAVLALLLAAGAGFWWLGSGWNGVLDSMPNPVADGRAPVGSTPPGSAADLTDDELERAEAEARYALAQVARVTERTGLGLRDDVLHRHILAPTAEAFTQSIDGMYTTGTTSSGEPR